MPKTGATRYQKFLKSEKSKTKLKAKKDLPKGTNVTKTNFKVKKIVLKEQLKTHGTTEALSTRKLNIKELISRLNHFNTHSRTDALEGLKELITSHSEVLEHNLGELVHGITPLVLNIEKVVRQHSLKVLHLILSNCPAGKIDPFFDILCTYLRSAMTHIDGRIQEDSLLFLDTLLLCTPKKVAQDFHKIIPNFLDMISKLQIDSKPGRTLTVNLGSQITSVKWRVKVLHRLKDYLQEFIKFNDIQEVNTVPKTTKMFNPDIANHFLLFNPIYIQSFHVPCFSSKNSLDVTPFDEVDKFKEYVNTLMPLLIETWLEVCPNAHSEKNMETVINEDAALLLQHVINVVSLIWSLIKHYNIISPSSNIQNDFCQKYRQAYLTHFVKSFPYITNIRGKQRSLGNTPTEDIISDSKLVIQNLEICLLFIVLNPFINIKKQSIEIMSILNYIENTFNKNTQDNVDDMVIKILNSIFSKNVNNWTKNLSVMDTLFNKIISVYSNRATSSLFKQKIFSLLCRIALNDKLSHFHNSAAYNMWLQNLPDILLEPEVTLQTIEIIHKFATRNNNSFNIIIKPKMVNIIKNLPNIVISDAGNDSSGYYKLFSLFYYVKVWDEESLNILEKQLLDNVYKNDHGKFIFDTLRLRTGGIL